MLLTVGIVMANCAKTDVFEENQKNYGEQQKSEYKANFVAKYGQPDANQSWDFAATSTAAKTRAGETMTCSRINAYPQHFNKYVKNDRDQIKNMVASADVKPWNPYLAVEIFPSLGHGVAGGDKYFELAVCYNNQQTDIFGGIKLNKNSWADKGSGSTSNLPHNSGRYIDTKSLTTAENVYWVAYNYNSKKSEVDGQLANFKIEYYKELKLNGRTYWCFDCTGDGDYSNLICMVIDADPLPIEKRYLVEDLGSKDDFDFNDIVFDVKQAQDGTQKCVIRAMGGTLDFTLKIGNTTWTKSVTIALPAKAGLNIQPTLKGAVADGEYTLSAKGQMSYNWLDQNGEQLQAGRTESVPSSEAVFYADGLGQYLGAITANCQLARAFAMDYSVTDTSITWGGNAGDDSTQGTGISNEGATGDNR